MSEPLGDVRGRVHAKELQPQVALRRFVACHVARVVAFEHARKTPHIEVEIDERRSGLARSE